jgi:hypothetical protein
MPGIETLPLALLLLMAQFAIGSQLWLFVLDVRATVSRGLVRVAAVLAVAATALSVWLAAFLPAGTGISGFSLQPRDLLLARGALLIMLLLSMAGLAALWSNHRFVELAAEACASVASVALLVFLAAFVRPDSGSLLATVLSLLAGSLALGGVCLAMTLGHWYLVTPRLPEQPLNEMTLTLFIIIVLQLLLLIVNLLLNSSVRGSTNTGSGPGLGQNPAFWLRVGVGFGLGGLFTFMAWQSSRMRGMMSATGLLYLATGAVLAGQALACSLIFTTAIPG